MSAGDEGEPGRGVAGRSRLKLMEGLFFVLRCSALLCPAGELQERR